MLKRRLGFTLIEVLIALLIMAIGFLGLANIQIISLKNNQSAYNRSQATLIAYDVIDRMRLNSTVTPFYLTTRVGTQLTTTQAHCTQCTDLNYACTPTQIATLDLCEWQLQLSKLPVGATGTIHKNNAGVFELSIVWYDHANVNANEQNSELNIGFYL